MAHVIIIGSGPAGVSAALYTARAGINTTIISKGNGALGKADKIENYYGFAEPVSGQALGEAGEEGAKRLGVEIVEEEVVGLSFENGFVVKTNQNTYHADCVILAAGASRHTPSISGLKELEGKGVSYCAVCDAFFYRNKEVAVLGSGEYALHEAIELAPIVKSVTILTNGKKPQVAIPKEFKVIEKEIAYINGKDCVSGVSFIDGSEIKADGIFVAYGIAGSVELARKIGAITEQNRIVTDETKATNVPGLFAAGDCTGGLYQISKAVYEGAEAGTQVIRFLRKQ